MKANGSFDDSWLIIPVIERTANHGLVRTYHWPALFLLFFSVIGIIGNLLVCLAIGTERRLHNPTNWYIFSLALADLLIAGVVIPLAAAKEFTGFWILGPVVCDFWIFLDVCSCTSSIMHIVVISIDRYLAIEDPLNVRSRQKKYQICFFITLIWLIAIFLSSPMIILGVINPYNITINGQCLINNQFFVIYGSVVSFVIPLIIVIVMYILTVRRLKKQIKQCQAHFAQEQITNTVSLVAKPFLRQKASSKNLLTVSSQSLTMPVTRLRRKRLHRQETSLDLSEGSFNNLCLEKDKYPSLTNDLENDKSFVHNEYTCPENPFCQLECACNNHNLPDVDKTDNNLPSYDAPVRLRSSPSRKSRPISLPIPTISHQPSLTSLCSPKPSRSRFTLIPSLATTRPKSSAVRNEQKAVKVLGVVFVIFVIAWFPFCIMNIFRGICKRCAINENLLNSFVWLGYVSASINPIVYTIFNRNFRLKFITLLKCQCLYPTDRQKQLSYYQSYSSLHGSRILRTNGLVQNDMRRFDAHRQASETILT